VVWVTPVAAAAVFGSQRLGADVEIGSPGGTLAHDRGLELRVRSLSLIESLP